MEQDKYLQSANCSKEKTAQVTEAKARQRENARLRSMINVRRTSGASTDNEAQSEVTERPPSLYQVPQINVPDNLHDAAKLIQGELSKIANSQSVLLSLWEKLKDQANGSDSIEFKKFVKFDNGAELENIRTATNTQFEVDADASIIMQSTKGGVYFRPQSGAGPIMERTIGTQSDGVNWMLYDAIQATDQGSYANMLSQVTINYLFTNNQVANQGLMDVYATAVRLNGTPLTTTRDLEEIRLQVKREIYAELEELNAGIVVPVVMNGSHNEN